jgi:hypothetical protein
MALGVRMPQRPATVRRRRPTGAVIAAALMYCVLALSATGPSWAASPDQAPPVPPGLGRIWFLRMLIPGTSFDAPMIYANGAPVAISSQGSVFYRDFVPGNYVLNVENCIPEANTSFTLTLSPGNQFALQVQQNDNGPMDCQPSQISYLNLIDPNMLTYLFSRVRYQGAH